MHIQNLEEAKDNAGGIVVQETTKRDDEVVEEIPDDLMCPISYELMTDPVIALDGITYQRAAFKEHIDYCQSKDTIRIILRLQSHHLGSCVLMWYHP